MNPRIPFSLPPGFSGLDKVVAVGGWFLCFGEAPGRDEPCPAAWHPDSGWTLLPDPGIRVESLCVPDGKDGVLVTDREGGFAFWQAGGGDWAWTDRCDDCRGRFSDLGRGLASLLGGCVLYAAGDCIVMACRGPGKCRVFREVDGRLLACGGLDAGDIRCAWLDRDGDGIWLLDAEIGPMLFEPLCRDDSLAVLDMRPLEEAPEIERVDETLFVRSSVTGREGVVVEDPKTFDSAVFLHLADLRLERRLGLLTPRGGEMLWECWLDRDRDRAGAMLDLVGMAMVQGAVVLAASPAAVATRQGILSRRDAAAFPVEPAPSCITDVSWLTWFCWLRPERFLPQVCRMMPGKRHVRGTRDRILPDGALSQTAAAFIPGDGAEKTAFFFRALRGCRLGGFDDFNIGAVQKFFLACGPGPEMASQVGRHLCGDDPACLAVACAAICIGGNPFREEEFDLWQEIGAPWQRIVELVGHSDRLVAEAAVLVVGARRILWGAEPVAARLSPDFGASARKNAADALIDLAGTPAAIAVVGQLRQAALCDPDCEVRQAAYKVLGMAGNDPAAASALVHAFGDPEFFTLLSSGCDHFGGSVTDPELMLALADVLLVRDLTRYALGRRDREGLPLPVSLKVAREVTEDEVYSTIVIDLYDACRVERMEDVLEMPRKHLRAVVFFYLLGMGLHCLNGGRLPGEDRDELAVLKAVIDRVFPENGITAGDLAFLRGKTLSPYAFAALVVKMERAAPEMARRLAVMLGPVLRNLALAPVLEKGRDLPLHLRLKAMATADNRWVGRCVDMVRQQAGDDGIAAFGARLSLALGGEDEQVDAIRDMVLSWRVDGFAFTVLPCLVMLDDDQGRRFFRDFVTSAAVPAPVKDIVFGTAEFYRLFAGLDERDKRLLYHDLLESPYRSGGRSRLEVVRLLADMGELDLLEKYWLERERAGLVDVDERPEYCRDLAVCGHCEQMEVVRREMAARMDSLTLMAFARCGTPDDIPALRRAVAEGFLSEGHVRQVVDGIYERHRRASGDGASI